MLNEKSENKSATPSTTCEYFFRRHSKTRIIYLLLSIHEFDNQLKGKLSTTPTSQASDLDMIKSAVYGKKDSPFSKFPDFQVNPFHTAIRRPRKKSTVKCILVSLLALLSTKHPKSG